MNKRWANNGKAGNLRRYRAHYDVTVMGKSDMKGTGSLCMAVHIVFNVKVDWVLRHKDLLRDTLH